MRSIKIMLLGISMMIFAGIFIAYPMGSLGGAEFFLLIAGFFISVFGFIYEGKKK
ncbi:hypothetical protein [Bacillus sp. FJAT-28004]|uniref:hypothetical protein n=1 Tax=Bacillus sp. FJAT-28004 TaxID=1679165 RepID=UPI000AC28DB5|nr:hypothetical protein [Bacillus sp. FJAT-28004]